MTFDSKVSNAGSMGKLFYALAVAGVMAAAVLLVITGISDYDTFWHLANGKAMVETKTIIEKEIFSYTAYGKHFHNHEWLYQIISYLFYSIGGPAGVVALKGLITLLIVVILTATAGRIGLSPLPASMLAFYVVIAGLSRFTDRPQLFSFIGISLLGYILIGFREEKTSSRALAAIPVIMLVWDCVHGSIYGIVLMSAFVFGESIKPRLFRRFPRWEGAAPLPPERLKALWLCSGITLLVLLANPYGLRTYDVFFNLMNRQTEAQFVGEFMPTPHNKYYPFWLFLFVTVAASLSRMRKIDPAHILILAPFVYLAVRYTRGMEAFNLVAFTILVYSIPSFIREMIRENTIPVRVLLTAMALVCIVYAVWFKFYAQNWDVTSNRVINDYSFGLGINENYFPVGSTRFIKEVGLTGNMFNSDRFGGYMAFFVTPERKIFQYNHPSIFTHIYGFLHDPAERSRWNLNYAVVARDDEYAMFEREGFVPVYWEPSAMLLVKNSPQNRAIIDRYAIRLFKPLLTTADYMSKSISRGDYPVLMTEMGTYLAYRRDDRVAGIFNQMIRRQTGDLSMETRITLINNARRYNAGISPP